MYHQTVIIGHIGRDAEMKYLEREGDATAVCNFSVAANERRGDKEVTTWYRVAIWGKLAEALRAYLTKGKLVMVEGRVSVHAYLDKEGKPAASLELRADKVVLLGSGSKAEAVVEDEEDEDIPF